MVTEALRDGHSQPAFLLMLRLGMQLLCKRNMPGCILKKQPHRSPAEGKKSRMLTNLLYEEELI